MGKEIQERAGKTTAKDDQAASVTDSAGVKLLAPSLILLLAFSILSYYLYQRIDLIEKQIQANSETTQTSLDKHLADARSRYTETQKKLDGLASKQNVLSQAIQNPVERQIHINKDYALAEIEHLLIIASYNLSLNRDIKTALAAMQSADKRMSAISDPRIVEIRKQLIADMNMLRSVNQADLSGLGLYLSDFIKRVDQLPLKNNIVPDDANKTNPEAQQRESRSGNFFQLVWRELKSLVIITRDKEIDRARLLPDEIYFLRANLKLELANARFAVFTRDTDNLRASILLLQDWLSEYFDLSDASVSNIYDSLTRMQKLDLKFPKLDISSSLESVRALSRRDGEADKTVDNGPEPVPLP